VSPSGPSTPFKNLALAAATTLIFGGLIEGAARIVEPPPVQRREYLWDWKERFKDGEFYTLEKGEGYPPDEENNVDGLRDATRPVEALPHFSRRVVILGDSVTFGHGVDASKAFPQILERRLRDELNLDVDVFNMALPGWSTRQERLAYERIARKYTPEDVVLAVCLNDLAELQINLSKPPPGILLSLFKRSAAVRLAMGASRREIGAVEELFEPTPSPGVNEAYRLFFEEVARLRAEAQKDRAEFRIVVFPFRFQVEPGAPAPVAQQRIATFAKSEGIPFHDFLAEIGKDPTAKDLFLDYDHFNETGHERVAAWLYREFATPMRLTPPRNDGPPSPFRNVDDAIAALRPGNPQAFLELALRLAGRSTLPPPAMARLRSTLVGLAVDHDSARVRFEAARALYFAGLPEAANVPALARGVQHQDPRVRAFATWTLGEMGSAAKDAVPALVALAKLDGGAGKTGALTAIGKIGGDSPETIPLLLEELKHPKENRRYRAARTIGRMGPSGAPALDGLIAALKDPAQLVRLTAARAIGELGEAGKRAVPELTELVNNDPDPEVRKEASLTLSRLPGR
jgi:lysophospholipase L1-like esterase